MTHPIDPFHMKFIVASRKLKHKHTDKPTRFTIGKPGIIPDDYVGSGYILTSIYV